MGAFRARRNPYHRQGRCHALSQAFIPFRRPGRVPCGAGTGGRQSRAGGRRPGALAAVRRLLPGIARLPRKARRALQRRWRRSLGGLALLLALGQAPALAASINVGGGCTLIDATTAANRDAPAGGCPAGSGTDTITLPAGSTQTLTSVVSNFGPSYGPTGLPVVTSAIVIDGNGSTIARAPAAPVFRILSVARTGNLTVEETTITGGSATADSANTRGGGGLFNGGTLTLTNSTVSGNSTSSYSYEGSSSGGVGGGL